MNTLLSCVIILAFLIQFALSVRRTLRALSTGFRETSETIAFDILITLLFPVALLLLVSTSYQAGDVLSYHPGSGIVIESVENAACTNDGGREAFEEGRTTVASDMHPQFSVRTLYCKLRDGTYSRYTVQGREIVRVERRVTP